MKFFEYADKNTLLSKEDIKIVEKLNHNLQNIADLTNADVFVDCFSLNKKVVVLCEARPSWSLSNYSNSVVGKEVLIENEPAVFEALLKGIPVRDIKAETQEGKTVKQDIIPITNKKQHTIAVLIQEKDITESVSQSKKFDALIKERQKETENERAGKIQTEDFVARESNHRTKNTLQMLVSSMRIQSRVTKKIEEKIFYEKNIQKVWSIATVYDILSLKERDDKIELFSLLDKICLETKKFLSDSTKINLCLSGDKIEIDSDIAITIATIINELIFNAVEHAFNRESVGNISVSINKGIENLNIVVKDDGKGFDVKTISDGSLGLKIVSSLVTDKLKNELRIVSDKSGTKATFGYKYN